MPKLETGTDRWDEFFQTSWWRDLVLMTQEEVAALSIRIDDPDLQDMGMINYLRGHKRALQDFIGLRERMNRLVEESKDDE